MSHAYVLVLSLVEENDPVSSSFPAHQDFVRSFGVYYWMQVFVCWVHFFLIQITARDAGCDLGEANVMSVALFPFHQIF